MKGVPPAPLPIKHRLSKPKTNDCSSRNTAPATSKGGSVPSSPVQTSPQQHRSRLSSGDLRTLSDARENLRRRVSQDTTRKASLETVRKASFETVRRVSLDSVRSIDIMGGGKDRKAADVRSPSIKDSDSFMSRRTSTMQDSQTIDVEAAITLLQELKKSASPEELVALHRALLPTKEVETVTSPRIVDDDDYRSSFASQSSTRRASRLPPGLATRGGTDEDLLRKPGQERSRSRPRKQALEQAQTVLHRKLSNITDSMTAPELASQIVLAANNRSHTPEEYSPSIGAFRAGTLRITNGTSSPEPTQLADPKPRDDYFTAPYRQADQSSHGQQAARAHPDALPVLHRVLHSARNRQQQSATPPQTATPPENRPVEDAPARPSLDNQERSRRRQSLQVTTVELPPRSPGVKASPTSAPADTKRYYDDMRRNSGSIPVDSHADASPKRSPSVGRNALINFASRLSTVYGEDSDGQDHDDEGTPDDALSKLMGTPRSQTPKGPRPAKSMKSMKERPVRLQHMDSGYGSDASLQAAATNQGSVKDARMSLNLPPAAETTAEPETGSSVEPEGDAKSIYNLSEFLSSPTLPSAFSDDATSPLSPKKSQRFLPFRSKSSKRNSVPVMSSPSAYQSTDTIPTIASISCSPASTEARQPKKLQKPMKRKQSLRKAAVKEAAALEISPPMPLTVAQAWEQSSKTLTIAQAWEQRLENDPSKASLDRTFDTTASAKSQEDLARGGPSESIHFHDSDVEEQSKPSSDRKRSFSRGRKGSVRRMESGDQSSELKKSKSLFRMRSKSRSQSRRRASLDSVSDAPVCTDFGTDGTSLGAGPYDISTSQTYRNPNLARSAKIPQSPWQVGLVKNTKAGMSEQEAAELARLKSRDVAGREGSPMHDRPHMAIPKKGRSESNATTPNRSVEDYYPDWQSKGKQTAPPAQKAPVPPRAYSMYAESIPPMPDLPADVARKAALAEEKVLKKMLKDSPLSSKRTSAEGTPQPAHTFSRPGTAKRGGEAYKAQEHDSAQEAEDNKKSLELLHPAVRPKSTDEDVRVEVRETAGSSSEQSSMLEPESRPATSDEKDEYTGQPSSPSHDAQHTGWPGWEAQSQRWRAIRQRRQSLGTTLPEETAVAESTDEDENRAAPRPPMHSKSPSIVVSRYITPLAVEHLMRADAGQDPTGDASRHADLYRDLIDNKENRPAKEDVDRIGSAISTGTFVTVHSNQLYEEPQSYDIRTAKRELPRSESAFSGRTMHSATTTTTTTTSSSRSRGPSPGGRVRTASGKFIPYNPTRAAEAERSRAFSLARLMGNNDPSTESLASTTLSSAAAWGDRSDQSPRSKRRNDKVVDRYSGGLQYEWTRENGFGGSAGTRHVGEEGTMRKGQAVAEQFGVDLGDVPIMLQRSPGY